MEIEDPEEKKSSVELINSESDNTGIIIASTVSWTLGYFVLRRLLPGKTAEYSCRLITLMHGLVASMVGLSQCFLNENPFEHPDWITNDKQNLLLIFSLGYFIFDLTWCSYNRTETGLMIVHHIYSIYTLKSLLSKGYSGAQACCSIGCMEITNPLLQLRWFIRSEGYHKTMTFLLVEVFFFILFFIFRLIVGSYILITVFFEKNDTDFKIATVSLYFISVMFMIQIIKYATLKYTSKGQCAISQIELATERVT
ncbi:TLC domain-containing protein 5-like [Coccinella septempunctata]|uniref:TLC domain-containing protein 5-like n=1 Tax=Coccinella septempunctata TaxID=41139 RepID=UPI001D0672A0|nr:TLC domain-containing protein 5-like [Coccinella septempunctata]